LAEKLDLLSLLGQPRLNEDSESLRGEHNEKAADLEYNMHKGKKQQLSV